MPPSAAGEEKLVAYRWIFAGVCCAWHKTQVKQKDTRDTRFTRMVDRTTEIIDARKRTDKEKLIEPEWEDMGKEKRAEWRLREL